ncbi:MAG: phosphatase PAP2 family protein [Candidatus Bathyarchaeota archaeon]|nr:phosphatase PAP2 family protein [Candidatus Termiticorpusculum sp.]MCL1970897.1 phosphatase PAP2 family protein [Candidatus Termiticorpusculum sp.]
MKTSMLQQEQNKKTVVCTALLVAFILFTIFKTSFQSIDNTVNLWAATIHTDTATLLAKGIHYAFDTITIVAATIVIAGFLLIKGRKIQSLLLIAATGGNALLVAATKTITQVARPENQVLHNESFAYPSGHCAGAIILIGLLTYYAWLKWGNRQQTKMVLTTIFSLIVTFVSIDRIYLNVHWLSDVIGGCLLGMFWLSFCIIFYAHLKHDNSSEPQSVQQFE